ncbi:unnamed protein product [Bathycoccus prasinos]
MKTKQPNKSRGKITLAVVVYVEEETKKKKKKRNVGVKSSFASSSREVDKSDDCFVSSSVSSSAKKETLSSESSKLLLLENVSIAIKDNIDVKGLKTGCGNPDFLRDFSPKAKTENAPLVEHLLREGGHVIGKTHMDELAWSLQGENYHYGTPRNERALGEMNRKRAEIIRNEVFRRRKSKTICIVPAAACAPPKLNEDASVVNDLRVKTLSLSSISGLTGLPEVVVPCVSNKNELPIGVGFIGWERKCDVALLQTLLEKRL